MSDFKNFILIIGRPNVGKSTLFNTLIGKKEAITGDEYGLTRDYQISKCVLHDIEFNLIDTAGYTTKKSEISNKTNRTINSLIDKAHLILFVVDISISFTSEDLACWSLIRRRLNDIILVANKSELKDSKNNEYTLNDFGVGEYIKISAISRSAINSIYNVIKDKIPKTNIKSDNSSFKKKNSIRISIVGQPNVGKSTLYNLLCADDRVITAPVSGTTRDSILTEINYKNNFFQLIDTAGLRRKNKINYNIEKASAYFSRKEIRYANCAILIIDAVKGISSQDITLSNYIIQEGRSILLIFNKWDLIDDKNLREKDVMKKVEEIFFDAKGICVLLISSKEQSSRDKVFRAVIDIYKKWNKKINTSELNRWFPSIWENTGNQKYAGSLKFKYISQKKIRPPTFSIYHNKNSKVPKVTKRYITNKIRERFKLEGIPIRLNLMSSKNPYKK